MSLAPGPEAVSPLAGRDDDDLALLARTGRREAFEALVLRHQGRAQGIATRFLGDPALARDAAQNAFLELFHSLPTYRAQGRFTAFWHRILLNQCRMAARSRRTFRAVRDELTLQSPPAQPPIADEALIAHERQLDVERGLQSVSERHRVVLALRFAGGLSLQAIAETLDCPLGTVKSRLFAGLGALRETLNEGDR